MPRAIDHLVIPARDLSAQAEFYRRLGFQVGARNRHPWGTENHIVQFDGAFLELIGLGEGFAAPAPAPGVYSFAGFVAAFLARREGLAMLVLRSRDAEADRRQFKAEGIGDFARFDFARKARRPDGGEVDVAFALAFAASAALPEAGFFVCQQRFPENFWSRAAQVHANGARGIVGLAIAHENPREAADFLSRFVGAGAARREGEGFVVEADGARIECRPRAALAERYGASAIGADGPPIALARIAVADLAATRALLEAGGVGCREREGALIVGAGEAMGAALAFEAGARG
ncbi:MAG: VOC family protein [Roseiarcus sp.]|jgi:catechol 2,3-dioxygenase-like lactoylglutathione lyase family enzyme